MKTDLKMATRLTLKTEKGAVSQGMQLYELEKVKKGFPLVKNKTAGPKWRCLS